MLRDHFGPVDPVERLQERLTYDEPLLPVAQVRIACETIRVQAGRCGTHDRPVAVLYYAWALGVILAMLPAARHQVETVTRDERLIAIVPEDPVLAELLDVCRLVLEADHLLAIRRHA